MISFQHLTCAILTETIHSDPSGMSLSREMSKLSQVPKTALANVNNQLSV